MQHRLFHVKDITLVAYGSITKSPPRHRLPNTAKPFCRIIDYRCSTVEARNLLDDSPAISIGQENDQTGRPHRSAAKDGLSRRLSHNSRREGLIWVTSAIANLPGIIKGKASDWTHVHLTGISQGLSIFNTVI